MTDHPRSSASRAPCPASPEEAPLDRVPNPHPDTDYLARFTAPEFTSLCPVTGQPDFALLVIDYVPGPLARRVEVPEALSPQLPQPRRLPRGLHGRDRQAPGGAARTPLPADRRLLVPARRHPDRRVLADRRGAEEPVAAGPGRRPLSGAGLTGRVRSRRPRGRRQDDDGRDAMLGRRPIARRPTPNTTTPSAWPQKNEKACSATAEARACGATR